MNGIVDHVLTDHAGKPFFKEIYSGYQNDAWRAIPEEAMIVKSIHSFERQKEKSKINLFRIFYGHTFFFVLKSPLLCR